MKKLIITLFSILSFSVFAGDFTLQIPIGSHHTQKPINRTYNDWNESNQGIGLQYNQSEDVSWQVGFYENSEYRNTSYALIQYQPLHFGNAKAGAFFGPASGYKLTPVIGGLMMQYQIKSVVFTTRFVPKVDKRMGSSVFSFEVGYNF